MVAVGLTLGISKRELLESYYLDEFTAIVEQHNKMNAVNKSGNEEVFIDQLF